MKAIFRAESVVKRYGQVTALDGVGIEVAAGELFGLLGPNGAGKSTLVRIGCGLAVADAGRVLVGDLPAGSRAARGRFGYLAEVFRFPGWLTAREVMAAHQRLAASGGGAGERDRLLGLLGLGPVSDRRVDAMSKGCSSGWGSPRR